MLLQSNVQFDAEPHTIIEILPALPKTWSEGEVKGLRARGGYEIDATWKQGKITSATIKTDKGGIITMKYNGKSKTFRLKQKQIKKLNG